MASIEDVAIKLKDEGTELIQDLRDKYTTYLSEKRSLGNIFRFTLEAVRELIEFAEEATAGVRSVGKIKKEYVVDAVKALYKHVDPDIPWIPAIIEGWIENAVLDKVVPEMIDWVVEQYNRLGFFKKGDE